MNKPKYILNFTVCDVAEEQHVLYFEHETMAKSVYLSLSENDMIYDCYLSAVMEVQEE